MEKLKFKIKTLFDFWKDMWARELSASLAFYFITGIVPSLCVLFLLVKDTVAPDVLSALGFPEQLKKISLELTRSASAATKSGSIIFILTSIYSTINLFYRFRKCGEALYKFKVTNKTIYKRAISSFFMLITVVLFAVAVTIYFFISNLSNEFWVNLISGIVTLILSLVVSLILNFLVCPYRLSIKEIYKGAILTFILWLIITVGYSLYLKFFANFDKTYGALGGIFALIFYVYLIMQAFTFGVIFNIKNLGKIKKKKTYM